MAAAKELVLQACKKTIRSGVAAVSIEGSRTVPSLDIQNIIAFVEKGHLCSLATMRLPQLLSSADAVALLRAL